jgi:hypothetical protein
MKRTLTGLCGLAFALMGAPAFGAVIIDFGTGSAGSGGTITINGSNAIGANIPIGSLNYLNGTNTPSYTVSAFLNFDTSANTISITGYIPSQAPNPPGTPNPIPGVGSSTNPVTLLSGTFGSFTVTPFGIGGISVNGTGPDSKAPALLTALGLPTNTQFTFFGFSIGGIGTGVPNVYTATSTDIANDAVPEPTSIILLGTVVFGISRVLRQRLAKA